MLAAEFLRNALLAICRVTNLSHATPEMRVYNVNAAIHCKRGKREIFKSSVPQVDMIDEALTT